MINPWDLYNRYLCCPLASSYLQLITCWLSFPLLRWKKSFNQIAPPLLGFLREKKKYYIGIFGNCKFFLLLCIFELFPCSTFFSNMVIKLSYCLFYSIIRLFKFIVGCLLKKHSLCYHVCNEVEVNIFG